MEEKSNTDTKNVNSASKDGNGEEETQERIEDAVLEARFVAIKYKKY